MSIKPRDEKSHMNILLGRLISGGEICFGSQGQIFFGEFALHTRILAVTVIKSVLIVRMIGRQIFHVDEQWFPCHIEMAMRSGSGAVSTATADQPLVGQKPKSLPIEWMEAFFFAEETAS